MKTIARFGLLAILALAAGAQTTPPIPRTADGKPDLSDVRQGGNLAFAIGAERAKTEQSAAPPSPAARREPPPYQPWAAATVLEYVDRKAIDDPMARCLLIGVPRITSSSMPMQIAQMPGQVICLYETFHAFRVVATDGRKHPDDVDSSFMGDSVGHWEGDALVVDVVGFNDKTWLAGVGSFHTEALHVNELYTRASYNTTAYDVTLEDPKVFTKPWSIRSNIGLRRGGGIAHRRSKVDLSTLSDAAREAFV
jgi:hypothetical protein